MKTIYKYTLGSPVVRLSLPSGACVLTAQIQRGAIVLWALIDPEEIGTEQRCFTAINTGNWFESPGRLIYINTVSSANGIVWHVFEVVGERSLLAPPAPGGNQPE